ncbi:histidine kinase [Streptomyces sp. G-G2]|uniref:sensor histidine kinase n=1 Tax=Streptomyces sp. G-G2 TaxID=3046201 RepID=UPI0024B8FEC3|nr:histidine kinase [Streptomyces sp. G-G2]MDJ0379765.1 histidine kinase [Streptomyces sp. G-G2]
MSFMGRVMARAVAEAVGGGLLVLAAYAALIRVGGSAALEQKALLMLAALTVFVVRRRFPEAALVAMGALLGLMSAFAPLAAVTAYTVTRQLAGAGRRATALLGASAVTIPVTGWALHRRSGASWDYGLTVGGMLAAVAVLVPGLVGASAGQQQRLLAALRERTAAAEEARRLTDSESRIHERSRIAAEMHDLVGHRLSLISLHTGGLEMALRGQPQDLRDSAALVRRATRDAMRELREVLGVLGPLSRDTGTDALTDATGTRADIEALVEESRAGGVAVDLTWTGPDTDPLEARVRRALHRVVREALTNVHRYAPGAAVEVAVAHTADLVEVSVANGAPAAPAAGAPAPPAGSGRGLPGLRERVDLLGGTLAAGPRGAGFAVAARLPARPGDPGAGGERASPGHTDPDGWVAGIRTPARPGPPGAASGFGARITAGARRLRREPLLVPLAQTATALLGLAGIVAVLAAGIQLAGHAQPSRYVAPKPPRIGMDRAEAEYAGVHDFDLARAAAAGHEPPRARGVTDCVFPYSDDHVGEDGLTLVRYCFSGGVLTTIDRFEVPLAPRSAR